jgi:hypothetical protein
MDREGTGDGTTTGAAVGAALITGAGVEGLGDTACTDGRTLGTTEGDAVVDGEADGEGLAGTTGPTTGGTTGPTTGGTGGPRTGGIAGTGGAAGTVTATTELTVAPCESVTAIVGEKLPDPVGVPANTPSAPRVSPGGSEPDTTV